MAYTINVRGKFALGGPGGVMCTYGDYSSVNADTTTVTIAGGYPIFLLFTDAQNNPVTTQTLSAKATSGAITTFTLTSTGTVTNGNFAWYTAGE